MARPGDSVAVDLNNDDHKTTLSPWNDWNHIVFDGGLVGDAAGASLPQTTEKIEPAKKVLMKTARVLAGDHKKPKVKVSGPKHKKVKIKARDNRELDRIIIKKDHRTTQVNAADRKAETYKLKVGTKRHKVRVVALDAAGNASRVVKLTVNRKR